MTPKKPGFEKKMQPLEDLAEALSEAKRAKALLDEVWAWMGPYGRSEAVVESEKLRSNPSFQKFLRESAPPEGLVSRLQAFYSFDDSE